VCTQSWRNNRKSTLKTKSAKRARLLGDGSGGGKGRVGKGLGGCASGEVGGLHIALKGRLTPLLRLIQSYAQN